MKKITRRQPLKRRMQQGGLQESTKGSLFMSSDLSLRLSNLYFANPYVKTLLSGDLCFATCKLKTGKPRPVSKKMQKTCPEEHLNG